MYTQTTQLTRTHMIFRARAIKGAKEHVVVELFAVVREVLVCERRKWTPPGRCITEHQGCTAVLMIAPGNDDEVVRLGVCVG